MGIWLDFSKSPPPSVEAIKAVEINGQRVEGLLRYIGLGNESKQIHREEHDAYVAAGLRIGLVAELGHNDAWEALDDHATGQARARIALDDQRRHAPTAEFICCAADAHASSSEQISDAVEYARGFQSVLGREFCGFYGFNETSRAVHAAGLCRVHWRCGSEPSAEDKQWVNFWQRNRPPQVIVVDGVTCDINETFAPLEEDMPTAREVAQAVLDVEIVPKFTLAKFVALFAPGEANVRNAGPGWILLAQTLAAAKEDLDAETVVARLDAGIRDATKQAVEQSVLPALALLEKALQNGDVEQAKTVVTELTERLLPVA